LVVTSEALGPGSVLVSRERRDVMMFFAKQKNNELQRRPGE